jgi:hypothetical protein
MAFILQCTLGCAPHSHVTSGGRRGGQARAANCRPTKVPCAISKISGPHGKVYEATDGTASTHPRTLGNGKKPVANSEERLHSILVTLEECRTTLSRSNEREAAHLVSVAILELRIKLNRIADAELKALCDAMTPDEASPLGSQQPKPSQGQRRRPLLKLVK